MLMFINATMFDQFIFKVKGGGKCSNTERVSEIDYYFTLVHVYQLGDIA